MPALSLAGTGMAADMTLRGAAALSIIAGTALVAAGLIVRLTAFGAAGAPAGRKSLGESMSAFGVGMLGAGLLGMMR